MDKMSAALSGISAFLIDLDGVLYVGREPIPGARVALKALDDMGVDYRFVSNSTRRCRSSVSLRLKGLGYEVPPERIFTPSLAAVKLLKRRERKSCYLLTMGDVHLDLLAEDLQLKEEGAEAVILGDAGPEFTYDRMNRAFRLVLEGADFMAMEMDRYWREAEGLVLSTGPFVAALEYATGRSAELLGKPSPEFFSLALDDMGVTPAKAAMIGDDIITDVGGAQAMGMKGILVKTGKYSPELVAKCGINPHLELRSLASLVDIL